MVQSSSDMQPFPWSLLPRPSQAVAMALRSSKALRKQREESPASYLLFVEGKAHTLQSDITYRMTQGSTLGTMLNYSSTIWLMFDRLIAQMQAEDFLTSFKEWDELDQEKRHVFAKLARNIYEHRSRTERSKFMDDAVNLLPLLQNDGELSWTDALAASEFLVLFQPTLWLSTAGQGSDLGPLLVLADPDATVAQSDAGSAAISTLVSKVFSRATIVYLEDHFLDGRVEDHLRGEMEAGRTRDEAWRNLISTPLYLALHGLPSDANIYGNDLFKRMAGYMEGQIRDFLLAGC